MNKIILIVFLVASSFISACGNYDKEMKADSKSDVEEIEYTKEVYLIETANDVREIRTLQDKLVVQLAEEKEPLNVASTLMDISIVSTDFSYRLPGTESFEFDFIKNDLKEIQSYVDEKYKLFSEQKELDKLSLNLTITQLESLISKLESDFDTVH